MSDEQFAIPEQMGVVSQETYTELSEAGMADRIDPKAFEEQMMKEAQERIANSRPEDVASEFFKMYFPIYRNLLMNLSNKDARRVAEHVVQWPLENEKPSFNAKAAEEAFRIGVRLVDAKMVMRVHVEMENHKENQRKIEEQKQKEAELTAPETIDGEEKNE